MDSSDKPSGQEGFPLRAWSICVYVLDNKGVEHPADIFSKVEYHLHPTFPKPLHTLHHAPFKIQEEGWGEFDMQIKLFPFDKTSDHTIQHDLNFQSEKYEAEHRIVFRNPKPALIDKLRETGTVPGDENGIKGGRKSEGATKKIKRNTSVDMERLADGLQRLQEDDLLSVVQMVHDNKTSESYIRNDLENGEFHVDLYTLPDSLVKMLWDFVVERNGDR
ncbi:MAG: hypothetical protein M1814_003109 [Vezdaea aestivalis]|nr:MAG: hypothetical protein M1814_003109 [Vezdaea aestivalis]